MPNELRVRANGIGGKVEDNPLTAAATTLTSAGLAAVPVIGTTQHLALVLDPDGIDGAPEIVWITAHTAAATTATILRAQEGTTARQHLRDTDWIHGATVKEYDGSGGGAGLIGFTHYHPAVQASYSFTTTYADMDATNLKVDFVVPPSGKVLIEAITYFEANGAYVRMALQEATTILTESGQIVGHLNSAVNFGMRSNYSRLIKGLTPGVAKTYKLAAKSSVVAGAAYWGGDNDGAGDFIMKAIAVNL